MNAWVILIVSGLLEGVWAVSMKASNGFSHIGLAVLTFAAAWLSFWMLGIAMKTLPLGTVYTVWVGIGAICSVLAGVAIWGEPLTLLRVGSVALIVLGIIGISVAGGKA